MLDQILQHGFRVAPATYSNSLDIKHRQFYKDPTKLKEFVAQQPQRLNGPIPFLYDVSNVYKWVTTAADTVDIPQDGLNLSAPCDEAPLFLEHSTEGGAVAYLCEWSDNLLNLYVFMQCVTKLAGEFVYTDPALSFTVRLSDDGYINSERLHLAPVPIRTMGSVIVSLWMLNCPDLFEWKTFHQANRAERRRRTRTGESDLLPVRKIVWIPGSTYERPRAVQIDDDGMPPRHMRRHLVMAHMRRHPQDHGVRVRVRAHWKGDIRYGACLDSIRKFRKVEGVA